VEVEVAKSIVKLTGTDKSGERTYFSCTAFAIAPRKFMTAAHCTPGKVTDFMQNEYPVTLRIGFLEAFVIEMDERVDLAVIMADLVRPALPFRSEPLVLGENVIGVGHGYGFRDPQFTKHTVQSLNYTPDPEELVPGTWFLNPFIGGMSGGPIVDMQGQVVGVVQASSPILAYGVSVKTILEFLNGEKTR
jgi:hypothetical protein